MEEDEGKERKWAEDERREKIFDEERRSPFRVKGGEEGEGERESERKREGAERSSGERIRNSRDAC